ncbi:hypothetical protein HY480_04065 [Candidatus Uhrbacteria bacterium]|nr:hypothetical protein [Candidatus Uhrbacteria bacterium]
MSKMLTLIIARIGEMGYSIDTVSCLISGGIFAEFFRRRLGVGGLDTAILVRSRSDGHRLGRALVGL